MKYTMELDMARRSYEFYREDNDQEFLVFATGVAITPDSKLENVNLCKVVLPDSLLRFIVESGILDKYTKVTQTGQ